MAEREGFEPSIRFPVYTLSKRAPSAALSEDAKRLRVANEPHIGDFIRHRSESPDPRSQIHEWLSGRRQPVAHSRDSQLLHFGTGDLRRIRSRKICLLPNLSRTWTRKGRTAPVETGCCRTCPLHALHACLSC